MLRIKLLLANQIFKNHTCKHDLSHNYRKITKKSTKKNWTLHHKKYGDFNFLNLKVFMTDIYIYLNYLWHFLLKEFKSETLGNLLN